MKFDDLSKVDGRINVIYLGRRGGGVKLTGLILEQLNLGLPNQTATIHLRNNIQWGSTTCISGQARRVAWGDNSSLKSRVDYFSKLLIVLLRPDKLGFRKNTLNIITLTSPYSFPLELILKLRGRKVVLLVHDIVKHPGDVWPPNLIIRIRNHLADAIIALSHSVGTQIRLSFPDMKIGIFQHPKFVYPIGKLPPEIDLLSGYVLFVGRLRPYKGLEKLISAGFIDSELRTKNVVIAGEGKIPKKLPSNFVPLLRWLEDSEIASLIRNAEVIVFPYTEASQSGLIGTCIAFNKKVLVSNLSGLVEQVKGYPNGWICEDLSPMALSDKIVDVYSRSTSGSKAKAMIEPEFSEVILKLFPSLNEF